MNFKPGWHVLYVRANHEQKTNDLLQFKQLNSFLPKIKKVRKYKNCEKVIFVPLFPSYIFVNLESSLDLYKALSLKSSCSFIKFNKKYAIINEKEISEIKLLLDSDDIKNIEINTERIKVGDYKKLIASPFNGLECEIVNINNKNKVIVRLKSMRQNIIATVPINYIL
tara:strand:- start:2167 stop:2670 length:504 start_codon:yes stop_codon:yes gene_type:complete